MNKDFTIVYYTANKMDEAAAARIREDLWFKSKGLPIISVSHKPIDFGENICIGESEPSLWYLFQQALIGARQVKTKFMLCAEDDYLYGVDRFSYVPPRDDTFFYDTNRWGLNRDGRYFYRLRTIFGMCIAPTDLMIKNLENRFRIVNRPDDHRIKYFSEPGKYEKHIGAPLMRMSRIKLGSPTITFNHRDSLGKRRMVRGTDIVVYNLDPWGDGKALWKTYMGD